MGMRYENDERMISMAEIERILTNLYGTSEHSRECGCYVNGNWLSVEDVLTEIASNI